MVFDNPDARLHDAVALDEIELYGNLMIAAAESDGPLSQEQIDEILGVQRRDAAGTGPAEPVAADERAAAGSRG